MKEIYIISASHSDWDEYSTRAIFVTEDEELAKSYCKKANTIMERYRKYYTQLHLEVLACDDFKAHPRYNDYRSIYKMSELVKGTFEYEKVELRG